jgi:hypothetical protein
MSTLRSSVYPVALFTAALFFCAAGKTKKKAGFYYRETVLSELPAYKTASDSVANYCKLMRQTVLDMKNELALKEKDLSSPDTVKLTPMVKTIKKLNRDQLKKQIQSAEESIVLDSIYLKQALVKPLHSKLDSAQVRVKIKNQLDTIFDRSDDKLYHELKKQKAKLKDVTADMRVELGLVVK